MIIHRVLYDYLSCVVQIHWLSLVIGCYDRLRIVIETRQPFIIANKLLIRTERVRYTRVTVVAFR